MTIVANNQTSSGNSSSHLGSGNVHSLSVTVNSQSDDARWNIVVEQESGDGEFKELDVCMNQSDAGKPVLFVAKNGLNLRAVTKLIQGSIDLKIEID